jgi:hypothetical protein
MARAGRRGMVTPIGSTNMKTLKRNELFRNVRAFLDAKGVELKDGNLTARLRQGCDLLTDAINCAQSGLARVRSELDAKVDRLRQVIHEKTAPKAPPAQAAKTKAASPGRRKASKPSAPAGVAKPPQAKAGKSQT